MFNTHFAKLVALLFVLGLSGSALADNNYKSIGMCKTDFQTMDWNGGKVTVGNLKCSVVVSGSSGVVPNGSQIQNCLLRVLRMGEGTEIGTHCNVTDKDGDILYSYSERKQGDIVAGGKGKSKHMGGTGKYRGVSGGCEFTATYLPENWLKVESSCHSN